MSMTKKYDVIVQKYGGSSVADAPKIKAVARCIYNDLQRVQRIVVVVSAMGHTTNDLIALAYQVSADPKKRELDMLISCGERSSMALLAMALNDIGVNALSLTGSQSGIITDDQHSGAEIIAIKPHRVLDALQDHQVVIVAGFQGVSEKKEITTLRRGGSDTTAVAMAAALEASMCEIYTDVAGVMDIDPRIVAHAAIIPAITHKQMESMALYGARVVAHDAIRLARSFGITIVVTKAFAPLAGTEIKRDDLEENQAGSMIALTHLRALVRMTMSVDELEKVKNRDDYFLCGAMKSNQIVAYFSNDISQELVAESCSKVDAKLALITVHLRKNLLALPTLVAIKRACTHKEIFCEDIIVGHSEIFVVVRDEQLNLALRLFHEVLIARENN